MVRGIKILAENKDKGARGPQSSILAHAFSLLSLQSKASRKAFPSGLMKSISSLSTLVFFLLWGWGALPLGFIRHFKVFRSRCCCCCCCWKTEKNLGQMLMLLLWAFSLIKKKKRRWSVENEMKLCVDSFPLVFAIIFWATRGVEPHCVGGGYCGRRRWCRFSLLLLVAEFLLHVCDIVVTVS